MGAWGTKPFQNDSALDWLGPIEEKIERTFSLALRPLKKRRQVRFVFPSRLRLRGRDKQAAARRRLIAKGKVRKVVEDKLTMTTHCQHEALAAVVLVRSLPVLHRHGFKGDGTLIDQAERVLDQLLRDEGFTATWNRPAEYVAEIRAERRRVHAVVLKYRREQEAIVLGFVRKIKRMKAVERAGVVRDVKRGRHYRDEFEVAWERVTGSPLPKPPPMPKNRPRKTPPHVASRMVKKQRRRARARLK